MIVTRRHLRLALFAGLGWIAVEALLFWLMAGAIGFFPTLLLLTVKGVGGFMLLAANLRGILGKVALGGLRNGLAAVSDAGFAALGAFLIFLPGFMTTLAGLALFAPSVRMGLVRWLSREKKRGGGDGILSLDPQEWREVETDRPTPSLDDPPKPRRKRTAARPAKNSGGDDKIAS